MAKNRQPSTNGRNVWDVTAMVLESRQLLVILLLLFVLLFASVCLLSSFGLMTVSYDRGLKISLGANQADIMAKQQKAAENQKEQEQKDEQDRADKAARELALRQKQEDDARKADAQAQADRVLAHKKSLLEKAEGRWLADYSGSGRITFGMPTGSHCRWSSQFHFELLIKGKVADDETTNAQLHITGTREAEFRSSEDDEHIRTIVEYSCYAKAHVQKDGSANYDVYYDVILSASPYDNAMLGNFLQRSCDSGCDQFRQDLNMPLPGALTFDLTHLLPDSRAILRFTRPQ